MLSVYGFPFMLAMFVSFVLTPYIKKLAFKIGAVDKPDNRKVHKRIMPRLGGLAIYIAFMVAVVAGMEMSWDIFGILLGGTVIVALGVADDVYQLPAKVKLLGQIIAACILVAFDIRIEWVNNPLGGYFYLDMLSIPFTIFWVISFINVVNLIDGLDGLAAGVSAIASLTIILVAVQMGYFHVAVLTAALAGAIIGFIRYNFNPATIFMGDTGSLALGGIIGVFAILIHKELLLPILCGIFLVENLSVIMQTSYFKYTKKKYGAGKRIFLMSPLHHHYQKKGIPEQKIVTRFWIIGIALAIFAIITLKIR